MCQETFHRRRFRDKLRDALRGFRRGVRGEGNFFVHFFVAAAVLAAALVFQPSVDQWCLLVLCTAGVLAAEMFNTAIERLAKAVDSQPNPLIGEALDVASAAVLLAAIGAAAVGLIVFVRLLLVRLVLPYLAGQRPAMLALIDERPPFAVQHAGRFHGFFRAAANER